MKLKTYLIGSIQDAKNPNESRSKVEKSLQDLGFDVLNPCKFECNTTLATDIHEQKKKLENLKRGGAWEQWDKAMADIQLADEIAVISSEFVVVFWDNDKKHGGTIVEIVLANQHQIPVYCVNYGNLVEMNDWVLRDIRRNMQRSGGEIFPNNKQMLDFIEKKHKDYIKSIPKEVTENADKS